MAGLSVVSRTLPSAQLGLYQSKLQQARRQATQAQDKVRTLEAQANEARRAEAQAQDQIKSLENQDPTCQATRNPQGQMTGQRLNACA